MATRIASADSDALAATCTPKRFTLAFGSKQDTLELQGTARDEGFTYPRPASRIKLRLDRVCRQPGRLFCISQTSLPPSPLDPGGNNGRILGFVQPDGTVVKCGFVLAHAARLKGPPRRQFGDSCIAPCWRAVIGAC